jgi:hypothetical protein
MAHCLAKLLELGFVGPNVDANGGDRGERCHILLASHLIIVIGCCHRLVKQDNHESPLTKSAQNCRMVSLFTGSSSAKGIYHSSREEGRKAHKLIGVT